MESPKVDDPPDFPGTGGFRILAHVPPQAFLADAIGARRSLQAGSVLHHLEPGLFRPARIRGDPRGARPFADAGVAAGRRSRKSQSLAACNALAIFLSEV